MKQFKDFKLFVRRHALAQFIRAPLTE
jgi:hypothetical protein